MVQIARLIGGAGTGKTTELLGIMSKTLEAGVDPFQLGFVSFTRAARTEAATRAASQFGLKQAELERDGWFRTLHGICYRALADHRGELLTSDKAGRKWMQDALQADIGDIGESEQDLAEAFTETSSEAGMSMRLWDASRNRLEPLEAVYLEAAAIDERLPSWETVKAFVERYELRKRLDNKTDFVDILGLFAGWKFNIDEPSPFCEPVGECPELPVWFFDEQQDTSQLLDSVCRRLIAPECVQWVYVVGDPFQAIYGWAGADSRCFRNWEVSKERIMPKSYRCPAEILAAGEDALRDCEDYFDRGIAPAEHEGGIDRIWWQKGFASEIDPRDSWLLLARTNRLARQLASSLDGAGIPWLPTKGMGGWNAPKRNEALTALLALENGSPIDRDEWRTALDLIPAKTEAGSLLVRGTKAQWAEKSYSPRDEAANLASLTEWGAEPALIELLSSGRWRQIIEGGEAFSAAWERWGHDTVLNPKVRVGTVHSVKGSEADNVLLLTTSTHQCAKAMEVPRLADEERRVAYVGITRARRRLILAKERNTRFRMPV